MKNLFCFLLGFFLVTLLLPALSLGANLQWDACTGALGYNIYFTDGVSTYNYNNRNQTVCTDIDNTLNLPYDVELTFYVTAYNSTGESGESNRVTYTRAAYVPPEDSLPPVVIVIPGPVTIIIK